MSLRDTINQDLKNAMKAKETKKRDALRLLTSAFKQIEVDERKELSDSDIIKIIQKQVKSRNDAATQYKEANREDLMQIELDEIAVYKPYLPAQLSDEELKAKLNDIIQKVGATTMKDMGKVMGMASKELGASADGNYFISGKREILVDRQKQIIQISGVIRPYDIDQKNTVDSSKMSDARIFYKTQGDVDRATNQGWGTKVVESVWPF